LRPLPNFINRISHCSDQRFSQYPIPSIRHSRAGGNPGILELDFRLRGSDNRFVTYL
jgi:hypothetical protein